MTSLPTRLVGVLAVVSIANGDVAFDDDNLDGEAELALEKYVAGATDDLGRVFDLEKQLLDILDKFMVSNAKTKLRPEVDKIQDFLIRNHIDGSLLRSQVRFYFSIGHN
jgi:hypothetical protein